MQPRFMPDIQKPADTLFAGVETDAYAATLTFSDGTAPVALIEAAVDTPPPTAANHDIAFTAGPNSFDDIAPAQDANAAWQLAHDTQDSSAPADSGGLVTATVLPAPTSVSSLAAFAGAAAGFTGSQVAVTSLGTGGAFGTLASAEQQMFHFGPIATPPNGALAAASSATLASTHADAASSAHEASGAITEAAVGSGGATAAQVKAALDESGLSVNGSGIKVGVLSDSFNDLGGAAADEADGALPSAVQVLKDLSLRRHRRRPRDDADHP